jgi:hypothetical protein
LGGCVSWKQRRSVSTSLAGSALPIFYSPADYQLAEQLKLELDYSDEKSDFRKTNFPARHIYERVLPVVVKEFSDIHYHRASPYSGEGQPTTDPTLGDLHQCEHISNEIELADL